MSTAQELIASFDASDGYPDDAWIDQFGALPPATFTLRDAASFLVNDLPRISQSISCMTVRVHDGVESDRKSVEFHTGGWSGAESLIDVMLRQFWIKHLHWSWQRGGHFVFLVPTRLIDAIGQLEDKK